jgi:hypothetical protein
MLQTTDCLFLMLKKLFLDEVSEEGTVTAAGFPHVVPWNFNSSMLQQVRLPSHEKWAGFSQFLRCISPLTYNNQKPNDNQ